MIFSRYAFLAFMAIATASNEAKSKACLSDDDVSRLVQGFKAIISQNPVNQTLAAETIADNFTSISDSVNYVDQIPVRLGISVLEGPHADRPVLAEYHNDSQPFRTARARKGATCCADSPRFVHCQHLRHNHMVFRIRYGSACNQRHCNTVCRLGVEKDLEGLP